MAKPKTVMSSYVRTRREAMGLSQKEFSQQVGVYQSYVSLVEKGEKIIDPVLAARWAKRMRVPQQDFVQIALVDWFRKEKIRLSVSVADLRGNEAVQYETVTKRAKRANTSTVEKRAKTEKKTNTSKRAGITKTTSAGKRAKKDKQARNGKRAIDAEKPTLAKRAKQSKKSDQPKRATAKKTSKSAKRAVSVETPVVYEQVDNVTEFPTTAVA